MKWSRKCVVCFFFSAVLSFSGCLISPKRLSDGAENSGQNSYDVSVVNRSYDKRQQTYEISVSVKEKPEVTHAELKGTCTGNIGKKASVASYYPGNVLISNTVGLIGPPFQVNVDDDVETPEITLTYSPDDLRGVPEKNIAVMYVEEDTQQFVQVRDAKTDFELHTVTFPVYSDGVYLLFDIYEYGSAMGWAVSEYAYEKDLTDYISDWEREHPTGDIMKLADKQWAKENAPDFHISTPEQLASAVYYANTIGGKIQLYLDDDIDLTPYQWAPIGVSYGPGVSLYVDGQNHTIHGMTINMPKECEVGLTGYISNVTIRDLTFDNVLVRGLRYVGVLCGECHGEKNFHHLKISGNVTGDANNTGALVGAGAWGIYDDCDFQVAVNGVFTQYRTPAEKVKAEASDESMFTITVNDKGQIERTEADFSEILSWVILDGEKHMLSRGAEKELVLPDQIWEKIGAQHGKTYSVHLEGYSREAGGYIRVSNQIDYRYE